MDLDASKECCAPTRHRSGSGLGVLAGVGALVVCCALPSLLASGALAAVAGWSLGVWAAIVVVVLSIAVWWSRRRHLGHHPVMIEATPLLHGDTTPRQAAPAEGVE